MKENSSKGDSWPCFYSQETMKVDVITERKKQRIDFVLPLAREAKEEITG